MRIESVVIDAFGPLVSESLELAAGMTVLSGRNESAKSTWHAATYAALCGRKRGKGRATGDEQEFERRHRPWDRPEWMVRCVVVLDDGRRVELRQDLAGKVDCRATDLDFGRDVSSEIMFEGSPDALRWCGLNRRSYLATGCVRQAQLLDVLERADGLQEHLQQAAATGGTSTAAAALRRLHETHREHVGSPGASTKPLRSARDHLSRVRRALQEAQAAHAEYVQLCEHAQRMRAQATSAVATVAHLESAMATDTAQALRARLHEVRVLQHEVPREPQPQEADDRLAQRVAAAVQGWSSSVGPVELSGPRAADIAAEVDALPPYPEGDLEPAPGVRAAHAALQLAQARLEECEARQHAIHQQCDDSGAKHTSSEPLVTSRPDASSVNHDAESAELLQLADAVDERLAKQQALTLQAVGETARGKGAVVGTLRRRRTVSLTVALACLLGAVGLFVSLQGRALLLGSILGVVGLGAVLLSWRVGQSLHRAAADYGAAVAAAASAEEEHDRTCRRREEALQRCSVLGVAPEAMVLRQQSALRLHADNEALGARTRQRDARAAVAQARVRLASSLAQRGLEVGDAAVEEVLHDYVHACNLRAAQARAAQRGQDLRAQLQERQRSERTSAQLLAAREHALGVLKTVVEELPQEECTPSEAYRDQLVARDATPSQVSPDDGDQLVAVLQEWSERRTRARAVAAKRRATWNRLQALLHEDTIETLSDRVARAEREATRLAAHAEHLDLETTSAPSTHDAMPPQEPPLVGVAAQRREERVRLAREQAQRATAEADRLEGARQERERSLASVPALEEEVAAAVDRLHRIEDLDLALATTTAFLEDAQESAHRDIAPVLNATVASWLPRVTAERYWEVMVDPKTLEVRVRGQDKTTLRSAAVLSRGTAEQVYLLLRLALVQHLGNGERCPILLDDVSVQADAQRTEEVLELLHRLSQERQVIVFARQERVAAWARARLQSPQDSWIQLEPIPST